MEIPQPAESGYINWTHEQGFVPSNEPLGTDSRHWSRRLNPQILEFIPIRQALPQKKHAIKYSLIKMKYKQISKS